MFVRKKKTGRHTYLCIIESYRDKGKVKQRTIANLGRYDHLLQSGKLDALIKNFAKFSEKLAVLSAHREDKTLSCWAKEWGTRLVFRRLWEEKGDVPSWPEIIRDLRALQAIKIELDGKSFLLRSDFEGVAHRCFMAAGVKPPPVITQM